MFAGRLLIIDNHDSFTFNLVEEVRHLGIEPTVVPNDHPFASEAEQQQFCAGFDAIIVSPGPGTPRCASDVGLSVAAFAAGVPVLGVCLGHQLLAHIGGAQVQEIVPAHGEVDTVEHSGDRLFWGVPETFPIVRYHSLAVVETSPGLEVIARTPSGIIMALRHRRQPWWGVQFHPESIDAGYGRQLVANFLEIAGWRRSYATRVADVDLPRLAWHWRMHPRLLWLDDPEGTSVLALGEHRLRAWTQENIVDFDAQQYSGSLAAWLRPSMLYDTTLPFDFRLGWVGYMSYEFQPNADLALAPREGELPDRAPDAEFLGVERAIVRTAHGETWVLSSQREDPWLTEIMAIGQNLPEPEPTAPQTFELVCQDSCSDYLAKIAILQEEIRHGNSYEACLTTQLRGQGEVSLHHYIWLRQQGGAPYGAYFRSESLQILSRSPESFLKITGRQISSSPIKGTRGKESDPEELASAEKDIAENRMIVDLVRNDLARVAVPTTVQVLEKYAVHSFATVHQMISTISAQLREGTDFLQILAATFPGGSMTGAPKQRTMAILHEVEEQPRGIYSGAFGWIAFQGDADMAMVIRTLIARGRELSYGVGGAVLNASDPHAEFAEIQTKSRALNPIAQLRFPQD